MKLTCKINNQVFILFCLTVCCCVVLSGCTHRDVQRNQVVIVGSQESFSTISEAIEYAEDGDVIIINPGKYHESLIIGKSIYLQGKDEQKTIIDGMGTDDVIRIIANNVSISNLTVTNSGNNIVQGVDAGVDIRSDHARVSNVISYQNMYGIYVYKSNDTSIFSCQLHHNDNTGIYSSSSHNAVFLENSVFDNERGFYLKSSSNCSVFNNTFHNHSSKGLFLYRSYRNRVSGNVFVNNFEGVHIKDGITTQNTIDHNLFIENNEAVFLCCGAKNNTFYLNNFMNNTIHVDGYPSNNFDNGSVGNYWDDYTGVDENDDKIGDVKYNVTEMEYGSQQIDYFPLINPVSYPPLDHWMKDNKS